MKQLFKKLEQIEIFSGQILSCHHTWFPDLKSAFEVIDKNILLLKLEHYLGFDESAHAWFESYFRVLNKNSVLGPLLFVMFVNEIFL